MDVIPYGKHKVSREDIQSVIRALESDVLTGGSFVENFEQKLTEVTQAKYAMSCSSGTAALHLALLSIECGKGDAVIVPAVTFAATANSVLYCGATPVFADIDPKTKSISLPSLEEAIAKAKSAGLKLKAIIAVHFAGLSADMMEIKRLADKFSMYVIEDACHALGGSYANLPVGSCEYSHLVCFSFHPVKHISTGEGGAIATNTSNLAVKMQDSRSHGICKDPSRFVSKHARTQGEVNPWYQEMQSLGYNYRLSDINAALGISQLERLPEKVRHRRQAAAYYDRYLKGLEFLSTPNYEKGHAYHLYAIDIQFDFIEHSRRSLMLALREFGIGTQVHYLPVPYHEFYQNNKNLWLSVDSLENSDAHYKSTLSIPLYDSISDVELETVVNGLSQLLGIT